MLADKERLSEMRSPGTRQPDAREGGAVSCWPLPGEDGWENGTVPPVMHSARQYRARWEVIVNAAGERSGAARQETAGQVAPEFMSHSSWSVTGSAAVRACRMRR